MQLLYSIVTSAAEIDETSIQLNLPQSTELVVTQNEFGIRYVLGLVVVAILLAAGIILIKRLNRISPRKLSPIKMKVMNQLPLGAKKKLAVIEVAGEHILIGVTDHHISLIKSLSLLDEDLSDSVVVTKNTFSKITEEMSNNVEVEKKFEDYTEPEFIITQNRNLIRDKIKSMRTL